MAVTPFSALDDESCRTKLGAALTDGLIKRIGNSPEVRVSPISDLLKYDCPKTNLLGAGRELGVDSVVEGRVQEIADRVGVTVQVIRVSDGRTLCADTLGQDALVAPSGEHFLFSARP